MGFVPLLTFDVHSYRREQGSQMTRKVIGVKLTLVICMQERFFWRMWICDWKRLTLFSFLLALSKVCEWALHSEPIFLLSSFYLPRWWASYYPRESHLLLEEDHYFFVVLVCLTSFLYSFLFLFYSFNWETQDLCSMEKVRMGTHSDLSRRCYYLCGSSGRWRGMFYRAFWLTYDTIEMYFRSSISILLHNYLVVISHISCCIVSSASFSFSSMCGLRGL